MLYPIILALLSITACTASSRLEVRAPCDASHFLCFPPEGEEWDVPTIDTGIRNLFKDLRKSVENPWTKKRDLEQSGDTLVGRAPSDDDLCCKSMSIYRRVQHGAIVLTGNAGFFGDGCYSLRKRRAPFCYVSTHELHPSFFTLLISPSEPIQHRLQNCRRFHWESQHRQIRVTRWRPSQSLPWKLHSQGWHDWQHLRRRSFAGG